MRIPVQRTIWIREQSYVRAVRDQRVTHRDLQHHPCVPRPVTATNIEMAFYLLSCYGLLVGWCQEINA